jgi:TolB-like protein/DNA-binding winged helix-turn-helix (wHTH) protein/Tfp pilus assembly protein PilF
MNEDPQPAQSADPDQPFRVGGWLVEPAVGCLTRDGQTVKLEPKVMDLLVYLAQRPGRVLPRDELEQAVWAGTVVGYDALTSAIIKLRKAFGDDSRHPWLIETVSKKGYRLIAPVSDADASAPPAPVAEAGVATSSTLLTEADAAMSPAPVAEAAAAESPATKPQSIRWSRRRLTMAALAVVVLASLVVLWFALDRAPPDTDPDTVPAPSASIAVLPFANLSGDPDFEYFSDGITEDITTDLSKVSSLLVIARNSAFAYKDQPLSLKSVAEALRVRYVLEGSVRRSGDAIRINAKLIDAETGSHLWVERYDRHIQDIFAVQDDVTRNIVTALALTLTDEEKKRVARRYTHSIEAYDLFLRGQSFYARSTEVDNARARELYLRAIELDPAFARAHAAVALTHTEDFRHGWGADPAGSIRQAVARARQAVALDDSIPQTLWALGYVYVSNKQNDEGAAAAERAIALDPNNADAHMTLAYARVYQNSPQDAIALVRKAMRLNPRYPSQYPSILGRAYYHLGQYEQAAETLRHAVELNPNRTPARLYLVLSYVAQGKLEEASWEISEILVNDPGFSVATVDQILPVSDPRELARMQGDLRRAGLN